MLDNKDITLVECPRDAIQGWPHAISTDHKINYYNTLLKCGFNTLDFGSFVSPKAIPQMADTAAVIEGLDLTTTKTALLAIVANERGAADAVKFEPIRYLGFPFSISPTFQLRNANSTIEESKIRVNKIQEICIRHNRQLVVYLSMGFGNPYGDPYNQEILLQWVAYMAEQGIAILSLADTVGLATPAQITSALETLVPSYPSTTFGVHLHAAPHERKEKIKAAFDAGCRRFDSAMKGVGGCPMAQNDLVGNMDTEQMITFFEAQQINTGIDQHALMQAGNIANRLFV